MIDLAMAGSLLLALILAFNAGAGANDTLDRLAAFLKQRSNPDVVPLFRNQSGIRVTLKYAILNVAEADREHNFLVLERTALQHWETDAFRYNASEYGGVRFVSLPKRYFWTPKLYSLSAAGRRDDAGPDEVAVFPNGTVAILDVFRERIPCDLSDVETTGSTCFQRLSLWRYAKDQVDYAVMGSRSPDTLSYFRGSRYEVLASNITAVDAPWGGDTFQFLDFYVTIRQKARPACDRGKVTIQLN